MGTERQNSHSTNDLPLHTLSTPYPHLPRPTLRILRSILLLIFTFLLIYFLLHNSSTGTYLPIPHSSTHDALCETSPLRTLPQTLPTDRSTYPKIGKVTASFGPPDTTYENAIRSHYNHNMAHGYTSYILREQMLPGLWSKHAYLLSIIGSELAKPPSTRFDWLFWHDRDTLLMNPRIPLEIFLPPPGFEGVNLVVTNDRNGLNNGVFFVRVGEWSFKMFASALSLREYEPGVVLKYSEQSAMEEVIRRPWWDSSVAYVPQRWFNGYPPPLTLSATSPNKSHTARVGSVLIHFASNRDGLRVERMAQWDEVARSGISAWKKEVEETGYANEIAEYWERVRNGEEMETVCEDLGKKSWG